MVRFGLESIHRSTDIASWRKEEEDSIEYSSSSGSSSSEDDDDLFASDPAYDSDDSDEPAHPLGFSRTTTTTRFSLYTPSETIEECQMRWGYLYPQDLELDLTGEDDTNRTNQVTAIHPKASQQHFNAADTAPPSVLQEYQRQHSKSSSRKNSVSRLSKLLDAIRIDPTGGATSPPRRPLQSTVLPSQSQQAFLAMQQEPSRIQQEMQAERARLEKSHEQASQGLKAILQRAREKAASVQAKQAQVDQQAQEDAAAAQAESERQAAKQAAADDQKRKEEAQAEQDRAAALEQRKQEQLKAAQAAKEADFVGRAEKMMANLVQLRKSVEPFEKSKSVGKRRLGMKKIVNGKVNTLSDNADKIRLVAGEVAQAIQEARTEDARLRSMLESGDASVQKETVYGKRYFVDLLCSKVIVRVQAEGFNGQRGDGFPLASMLTQVAVAHEDLGGVLEAHIYTVCPTAIPRLPDPAPDASEEELMESLGMLKGSDGQYETFERFLSRTEGIISMVANIMSSMPSEHKLLGGQKAAVNWLSRFIAQLPSKEDVTLPLITAPVLDAFLTAAGHMMANLFEDKFKALLDKLSSAVSRLDEGPIGKPSSIRLKKTLEGGFDGFKNKLPPKAIFELYQGASTHREPSKSAVNTLNPKKASKDPFGGSGSNSARKPNPFGSSNNNNSNNNKNSNPFGAPAPSPFGGSPAPTKSPFGGGDPKNDMTISGGAGTAPPFGAAPVANSPFGGGNNNAPATSPFGSAPAPPPFGNANSNQNQNAFAPAAQSPFGGGGMAATPAPFGSPPAPTQSPFGTAPVAQSPFGGQANSQPFGSTPAPSPFGTQPAAAPANTFGSSPFGGSQAPAPSPFGGGMAPAPSPFGGGSAPPTASPFGGGMAPAPSPFGTGSAPTASPFGGGQASAPSPFGGMQAPAPSPFGGGSQAPAPSPFGTNPASNASPFGAPSTFGAQAPAPSPFGGGGGAAPNPSPFGMQQGAPQASTPFGGGSAPAPSPFGQTSSTFGAPNKAPCKFFARGQCRFGAQCKFSHDTGGAFGGPRR